MVPDTDGSATAESAGYERGDFRLPCHGLRNHRSCLCSQTVPDSIPEPTAHIDPAGPLSELPF